MYIACPYPKTYLLKIDRQSNMCNSWMNVLLVMVLVSYHLNMQGLFVSSASPVYSSSTACLPPPQHWHFNNVYPLSCEIYQDRVYVLDSLSNFPLFLRYIGSSILVEYEIAWMNEAKWFNSNIVYLAQGSANFYVKGQKVNFYFVCHTVSVITTQVCCCSVYHLGFFRETLSLICLCVCVCVCVCINYVHTTYIYVYIYMSTCTYICVCVWFILRNCVTVVGVGKSEIT